MTAPDTPYDVFISYSHADATWVWDWLRPRLEAARLHVCLDRRDFDVGVPSLVNMERAVDHSRHTLLVLTPAWVDSEWTAFEELLTQTADPAARRRRLIPLLLQPCQPPRRIAMLTYADFTQQAAWDTGLQRVIAAVQGELHLPELGPPLRKQPAQSREQRNRSQMLEKVRLIWIKGFLEPSLDQVARIELGLETKPDAVERPFDLFVQRPQQAPQPLPTGTPTSRIFDEAGKALLILGDPGAGKTTLLLELTRDLLDRAANDESHLIPVVFNLSSWAERRVALAEWLIDELNKRYDVPLKLAKTSVDSGLILPLLDGLDEVAADRREACVEAINAFLSEHGLLPLVVCSRVEDYAAMTGRLRLPSAVLIQPLSRQQIQHYVERAGTSLAGLRTVLQEDETLWDLLHTPLMLSIASLAYKGRSADEIHAFGTREEQRAQLFAAYTDAMFRRRARTTSYTREQTEHWLMWLARAMKDHNQSIFYVEWMQPNWVTEPRQQKSIRYMRRLMECMLLGLPLGVVLFTLDIGLPLWLFGMVLLVFCLLIWLLQQYIQRRWPGWPPFPASVKEIKPIEKIRWSWSAVRGKRFMLFAPLTIGPMLGLLVLHGRGLAAWSDALIVTLYAGLFVGLTGTTLLLTGFSSGEIALHSFPNEGIKRSMQNGLLSGVLFGLFSGLSFGASYGLGPGLFIGLGSGLSIGLGAGGQACLHHFALRLVLWHHHFAPLHYVRFLDYAAARIFLRKVGGGYVFVHRLLLEYFAALHQPSDERSN